MKKFNFSKGLVIGLLTLALVLTGFATVKASAEEAAPAAPVAKNATYTYADNSIQVSDHTAAVVYVLKQEKGNDIKKGAKAAGEIEAGASAKLALTDLKIKATTKDVYLYVCDKEFEDAGKVDANLVIKAQAAKKVVGKIDYTKADDNDSTAVLSIVATDKDKKVIEGAQCIWSTELDGTYKASTEFKGADLAAALAEDGGQIFVKMIGSDGGSGSAQFASKVIKVKIAKPAKAPKIKYDPKKDTVAIKNGFDFALATKSGETYTPGTWYTVLPVLKDATVKTAAASIVETSLYTPVDKKDEAAKTSYTQYKFKALSVNEVIKKLGSGANDDFILAARKSATAKKPASAVTYIDFADQTNAPIVYTASNVKGQFDVATTTDFEKKGFVIGTVANYNGANGTEGYDDSFKLKASQEDADNNAAAYEYCVVKNSDIATIDWTSVSWKKLDPAKTKITSKLKGKYNTAAKTGIEVTLGAVTKTDGFTPSDEAPANAVVLLVRRAGVKGGTVRPSDFIKLYVIKDGKNFILYSTVANGEEAQAYQVDFYTLQKNESGTFVWTKDTSIESLKGWGDKGENKTENVVFPTIQGAKFYKYDGSAVGDEYTASENKYTITVAAEIKVAVDKPVKVTYDLNKPEDVTSSATAPTAADTKLGKITPAEVTSLTGTVKVDEETTENWKVTGWYLDKEGTKAVTADTIYGEDTTIYAKWEKAE